MSEKVTAQDWLGGTGAKITETPKRVNAECFRKGPYNGRFRPVISFDPADPASVARARQAASRHDVPQRMCGDYCPLPCTLRRLENETDNHLMGTFGIANTGS
jgi:hypothetical protein